MSSSLLLPFNTSTISNTLNPEDRAAQRKALVAPFSEKFDANPEDVLQFIENFTHQQAPSSDESYGTDEDESDEWSICDDWLDALQKEQSDIVPESEQKEPMTELPYGLHWDYAGSISNTNENKMDPMPTTVKPEATKLFKTPIDAVMAMFPLLFWETVTNEIDRYAAF